MGYFSTNWGYPWVAVLTLLALGIHERGLRSLNRRSTRVHAVRRRRRRPLLRTRRRIAFLIENRAGEIHRYKLWK